jgi:enediyne polyketide synthase
MREGIMPISVDKGITYFQTLLNYRLPGVRMVVTNRFGSTPTLQVETPDLPFLHFLEQPGIYYPGVELVTDVEISTVTDLYLDDHRFRGERLLPAVVGLEAMAQIAQTVTGNKHLPRFERIQLTRPIVVPERTSLKIRLAALVAESGEVDVVIRSEETGFQIDHFRATCSFDQRPLEQIKWLEALSDITPGKQPYLPLNPQQDLYGNILFHEGRFQRLRGYLHLRATECVAELYTPPEETLFANYIPSELILGNFVTRDGVIHCIQACIPHGRLLPIGVEEINFAPHLLNMDPTCIVYARERSRVGDLFTYDVEVRTAQGLLREQWKGLQLLQVEAIQAPSRWNEALLGPYLERKFNEFLSEASLGLVLQSYVDVERVGRSELAFQQLLGKTLQVQKRLDGKPILLDQFSPRISASHHTHLTFAVSSPRPVGCDIEAVVSRSSQLWQDLLGPERLQLATFLASQTGEDLDTSGTRLWVASECLKKAGAMVNTSLRFGASKGDNWILLNAGSFLIATYVARVQSGQHSLVFAVCSEIEHRAEKELAIRRSPLEGKEKDGAGL